MFAELTRSVDAWRWLAAAAWLLCSAGCGGTSYSCGSGTHLVGGKCVPVQQPVCGTGTVHAGSVCVPADAGSPADAAVDAVGAEDLLAGDSAAGDAPTADDAADTGDDAAVDVATDAAVDVGIDITQTTCNPSCADGMICSSSGLCVAGPPPPGWICGAAYADGSACDCACGAPDPDCANAALPVLHCGGGACKADGTCAACVATCAQKTCGPDGCGGSCGTCKGGTMCTFGQCAPLPADASCNLICGGVAASGCSCQGDCTQFGTCCADFDVACGCVPLCAGQMCGDDGCGGSCGVCKTGDVCTSGQCIDDPCSPDPCSGHGTCNPNNGACACGSSFAGPLCASCSPGFLDYPTCAPDLCAGGANSCSGHGTCKPQDGSCVCAFGFTGSTCQKCAGNGEVWPECKNPCDSVACEDGNPCTDDSCNAQGACVHVANAATCTDGDACTTGDACAGGACVGTQKLCDLAVNAPGDVDDGLCNAAHCSLREAILAANAKPGPSLIGFVGDLAIVVGQDLPALTVAATIDGLGHQVFIDGGGKAALLSSSKELTLARLTLHGGFATGNGGCVNVQGPLSASHVRAEGCQAGGSGGAFYAPAGAKIDHATFVGNEAQGGDPLQSGGGAVFAGGPVDVRDTTFAANKATRRGGGLFVPFGDGATLNRVAAIGNQADVGGGAFLAGGTVVNSTFANNSVASVGGALGCFNAVTLLHVSVSGNTTAIVAGALFCPNVTLQNSWISGNNGVPGCLPGSVIATASLSDDASCAGGAAANLAAGKLGDWGGGTATFALPAGSAAIDSANDDLCGDPLVGGVDQRGAGRPVGSHCDIGAFEAGPEPCASLPDASTCSDGDGCTTGDACAAGSCAAGSPASCDDGNPCTTDACGGWAGCTHAATSGPCVDAEPCTVSDACGAGQCQPGVPANCDDGNACTADACIVGLGCAHSATDGACDDGSLCTQGESCQNSSCVATKQLCVLPSVEGLVAHYRAEPGSLDFDGTGHVTKWKDLSGLGHDLTPNGEGPVLDPLGVYGVGALDFGGAKGLQSKPFALKSDITVFLVIRAAASESWGALAHHGNHDTDWSIEQVEAKSGVLHFQSSDDNSGAQVTVQPGITYVLTARIAAGGARSFTASATTTTGSAADASSVAAGDKVLYIGKSDAGAASNAVIGEILYYQKPLSDSDRANVATYLRRAWGFSLPKADALWLDAGADASLMLDDTKHLNTWMDLSGAGHDATLLAGAKPEWVNAAMPAAKPAVRFSDAATQLQTASLSLGAQQTVFAVVKVEQAQDLGTLLQLAGVFAIRESGQDHWIWLPGSAANGPQIDLSAGAWQVLTGTSDATQVSLASSSGSMAQALAAQAGGQGSLSIGNDVNGGKVFSGLLAELRVFTVALHPLDRAAIEAELKGKFGL